MPILSLARNRGNCRMINFASVINYLILIFTLVCTCAKADPSLSIKDKDLGQWTMQWLAAEHASDPNYSSAHTFATLATVDSQQKPTLRMIEIKLDPQQKISFFTHINTRKALHLSNNHHVALHIWLPNTHRQISLEGSVKLISKDILDKHWKKMPRWMQLRFISSDHKSIILDQAQLVSKYKESQTSFSGDIPVPSEFIGYQFLPEHYEFYAIKPGDFAKKHVAQLIEHQWIIQQQEP
jgi:pyridoxamine 5'-phosphate oxidase